MKFLAFLNQLPLTSRSSILQNVSPLAINSKRPSTATTICATAADRAAVPSVDSQSLLANMLDKVPPNFRSSLLRLPEDASIAELGARHTKIIATVGPSSCSADDLLRLAAEGVSMIRLNMSHGDFDWHRRVIEEVRNINLTTPFVLAVMVDVGSFDSVQLGAFSRNPILSEGDSFTLTVRHEAEYPDGVSEVSNDGFMSFVENGDLLQCQAENGGVVELLVSSKTAKDVVCQVVSPGELSSRGAITVRGKSMNLSPRVDGEDFNISIARAVLGCPPDHLQFAVDQRVEYIALSFVESADQINAVKNLLRDRASYVGIVAKIESANALRNLESIVDAADAIMIARGDLGTTIHYEKVPYWQTKISQICRRYGKPCLISTHFLESMVLYPTPTRAEVTDMTEAVKQRVDALVLTAETASGKFPFKSVSTMDSVILRMQRRLHDIGENVETPPLVKDTTWWTPGVGDVAEGIANSAADLATRQGAAAILVFTQKGLMATLTSRCRPKAPIYAFTATPAIRNKMNMLYGVRPFRIQFADDPEETIDRAIAMLKERRALCEGQLVIIVADILGGREGASETELRKAFAEVAKGNVYITAAELRHALRLLSLKVSDRVEAQLSMSDVDLADAGLEIKVENVQTSELMDKENLGQYDFARFQDFASTAKEIVHTLQLRRID